MPEVWTPPAFDDIATSETVTASYLNSLGNSLRFLKRVGFTAFSSDVNVTATAVGSANQIASLGAITLEAVPHHLMFYCPRVDVGGQASFLIVRDSTTVIGTLTNPPANATITPMMAEYVFTPTAASHTYNVAGWNAAASTSTYRAGTGGTAGDATTRLAGFIALYRIPT